MTSNTDSHAAYGPKHSTSKLLLALLGAALLVMFITSFSYRIKHPSLVQPGKQSRAQEQNTASAEELTALMRMMQENPNDPEVLKNLAQRFMDSEDWTRAQTFLNKLIVANPSDTDGLYMLGISQYQAGQNQEAVATFEQLILLVDDPMARFNLAVLYGHFLGQREKATPHLKAILTSETATEDLKKRALEELEGKGHQN